MKTKIEKMEEKITELKERITLIQKNGSPEAVHELLQEVLPAIDEKGLFCMDDIRSMPRDAKISFIYEPDNILMGFYGYVIRNSMAGEDTIVKLKNRLNKLSQILKQYGIIVHGFDREFNIQDGTSLLNEFQYFKYLIGNSRENRFLVKYFSQMKGYFKWNLESGRVKGNWEMDMTETFSQIVKNLEDFKEEYPEVLIFTYGTLMKGECNHSRYLQDAAYLGRAYLEDHALYNIGWYPGAVEQEGSRVYGEVYRVDIRKMPALDNLESEGSLYHRKPVSVIRNGVKMNVQTYIYARGTENCEPIPSGDWHEIQKDSRSQLIWYLAYGSNILEERFLKYIKGGTYQNKPYQGCKDKSLPLDKRPFRVPYQVYFAGKSRRWNDGGVAFLDPADKISEGLPGRIYLITLEQFQEIQNQERHSGSLAPYEPGGDRKTFKQNVRINQGLFFLLNDLQGRILRCGGNGFRRICPSLNKTMYITEIYIPFHGTNHQSPQ